MTSIVSHVAADEDNMIGLGEKGKDVGDIQAALNSAGFRVEISDEYTKETEAAIRMFQSSQGLKADGMVGPKTASFLDLPHAVISSMATPEKPPGGKDPRFNFPHDDTASMKAFYGDPTINNSAWQKANLVKVNPPWQMFYDKEPVKSGIAFHRLAAPSFQKALDDIWDHYKKDVEAIKATGMHRYNGAYVLRAIRGSSRLSCHAFGAAVDFDAERNGMNYEHKSNMAVAVVEIFKANGAWWGGDYNRRQDPMHFQWAHEG